MFIIRLPKQFTIPRAVLSNLLFLDPFLFPLLPLLGHGAAQGPRRGR